jgi:hypothetical protein
MSVKAPSAKTTTSTRQSTPARRTTQNKAATKSQNANKNQAPAKQPTDKSSISNDGKVAKDDPKAQTLLQGLGDNYSASKVKTDSWKKGPNDTIEGMLKEKGFSLKDIYTKGEGGKNMVDRVMGANNIKDARKIRDGQELTIPDLGKKGAGTSTAGLQPGQSTPEKAVGDHKIKSEKLENGTNQSSLSTTNGTDVKVQSPGNSSNATRQREDGSTTTQTLAKDAKGQVTTQVDTRTQGNSDEIKTKALKGELQGQATQDGVKLHNGDVKVDQNLDERKRDGTVENAGRSVAEFFGYKGQQAAPVDVKGKDVTTTAVGNDISVSADGKQVAKYNQDADDTLLERGGAAVDRGIDYLGNKAVQAGNAVRDTASNVWNWVTGR